MIGLTPLQAARSETSSRTQDARNESTLEQSELPFTMQKTIWFPFKAVDHQRSNDRPHPSAGGQVRDSSRTQDPPSQNESALKQMENLLIEKEKTIRSHSKLLIINGAMIGLTILQPAASKTSSRMGDPQNESILKHIEIPLQNERR
jgi:hypothetical protein